MAYVRRASVREIQSGDVVKKVLTVSAFALLVVVILSFVGSALLEMADLGHYEDHAEQDESVEVVPVEEPRIRLVQKSGTIRCHASMAAEVKMESGQDLAPLRIENPLESSYPIRVSIVRNSNAQSIYSSPVIQPGERLESAALREALEPGEHPCSVTFDTMNGDTQKTIAQASGSIIIKVDS